MEGIYLKHHEQCPVIHGLIKAYEWATLFAQETWQDFLQYFIRQTIMHGGMTASFKEVYMYFPDQIEEAMNEMGIPLPYRC